MRVLDDPKLLAQCARIKAMIEKVAHDPKYQDDYYAEEYHHWQISPPVQLSEIEEFEKQAKIELPIEYVYYLTQVGRGGAAPGTHFNGFTEYRGWDGYNRVAAQFSSVENCMLSAEDWKQRFSGSSGNAKDYYDGTITLCEMDITYVAHLIVSGPLRGRVVYLDYDRSSAPIWPKKSPNFLDWCENFYSELLAGFIDDSGQVLTWRFMWQEPGDEHSLISAFENSVEQKYCEDVLYSFCKFQRLSTKAHTFLKSIQQPEFQKAISEVLQYFSKKDIKSNGEQSE
ncbi:MAG: hypothetical protein HFI96_09730 [Lachnospiraceae bacterium]|jgi:hypothetical protein|nr:hypothetical protein [Lachnospiraceae bacterium]